MTLKNAYYYYSTSASACPDAYDGKQLGWPEGFVVPNTSSIQKFKNECRAEKSELIKVD